MQLRDLVKDITKMSDEELHEHIRGIRHNKYVARPAASKRRADDRKRTTVKPIGRKVDKIVEKLTPEQRADLIRQLTGD